MNNIAQYYQILGVTSSASPADIKQAYRNLAKIWHPDRFINNPILKQQAEIKIKEINQAYEMLKSEINHLIISQQSPQSSSSENSAEFYYQQGVSFAMAQQYQQAITQFTLAIRLNAVYIEAYQYRGFTLAKLGYDLRADADLKKAAQLKLAKTSQTKPKTSSSPASVSLQDRIFTLKRTIVAHQKPVGCVAISSNNSFFITGSSNSQIKLWDLNNGQAMFTLGGHLGAVNCLAISQDNLTLVSGGQDKTIKIWDLKQRKIMLSLGRWLNGHSKAINSLQINSNNNTLISGSVDNSIKIWDLQTGAEIRDITSSLSTVNCLTLSADGHFFCSGGFEKQLRIRNAISGTVIRSIKGDSGVLSLTFSYDDNLLATGGLNCNVTLWDITTGKKIYVLTGHSDRVSTVAFHPNCQTLISGSWDGNIKLWDLKTGQEIDTITEHHDRILSLAIAPDGKRFISSSADNTVRIWQLNL